MHDRNDRTTSPQSEMALVTGATGYIGTHLVQRLLDTHVPTRILQRHHSQAANLHGMQPEIVTAPLEDVDRLTKAMTDITIVYHFAGAGSPSSSLDDYRRIIETNVTGTLNLLTAAVRAGVRRVVLASTAAVYGHVSSAALREDMTPQPMSMYGISKLAAEQLCSMFHNEYGLETVALRYFNVYGPDQDRSGTSTRLIPMLMRLLRSGEPVTLYGNGEQTRDFVYIDDVVAAAVQAGEQQDANRQVVNIGSGTATSLRSAVEMMSDVLNVTPNIRLESRRDKDIMNAVADISLARQHLTYEPCRSFHGGIERTAATHNATPGAPLRHA